MIRDAQRLNITGLTDDLDKNRNLDRNHWFSVMGKGNFPLVHIHRLTVYDSDRDDVPGNEYLDDADCSWSL